MRLIFILVTLICSHYNGFSQLNLPDWITARPSPANVGYNYLLANWRWWWNFT